MDMKRMLLYTKPPICDAEMLVEDPNAVTPDEHGLPLFNDCPGLPHAGFKEALDDESILEKDFYQDIPVNTTEAQPDTKPGSTPLKVEDDIPTPEEIEATTVLPDDTLPEDEAEEIQSAVKENNKSDATNGVDIPDEVAPEHTFISELHIMDTPHFNHSYASALLLLPSSKLNFTGGLSYIPIPAKQWMLGHEQGW